jgi:hypothetical protein
MQNRLRSFAVQFAKVESRFKLKPDGFVPSPDNHSGSAPAIRLRRARVATRQVTTKCEDII